MALRGTADLRSRRDGSDERPGLHGLPGASERAEQRDPCAARAPGPPLSGWFDPRGRTIGGRGFALNRITGLALLFYLYLHLGVLSMLLAGASAWGDFAQPGHLEAATFLALDVVLLFGVLFHGLNGIRVALVGSGIGVEVRAGDALGVDRDHGPDPAFVALHVFGAL